MLASTAKEWRVPKHGLFHFLLHMTSVTFATRQRVANFANNGESEKKHSFPKKVSLLTSNDICIGKFQFCFG